MKEFDLDPVTERALFKDAQGASCKVVVDDLRYALERRGGITSEELLRKAHAAADNHASVDGIRK